MNRTSKSSQLQIRVSPHQKAAIARYARKADMGISEWVLSKALPCQQRVFGDLLGQLKNAPDPKYVLAEIHDLLNAAVGDEFDRMVVNPPPVGLSHYLANYIAAMVEYAAVQKGRRAPSWTADIASLEHPVFGSDLNSLRLYLLTHSPPPFRRRNIFIDSTIGQRV
jgi:hypothetical protein